MSDPAYDEGLADLRVERPSSGVVLVSLDLPDRRNMMSAAMTESWARVMAGLAADHEVRAVVVTGAGSAFCSGGDMSWIGSEPGAPVEALRRRMLAFYRTWLAVLDLEVPTIAALNGAAIGAGLGVALACDLRYAAEDAALGVPFTALGMHPGMGTTHLLPQVAGDALARELLLTGRVLTGVEAAAAGLVSAAVPAGQVRAVALAAAAAVAAAAPIATRLTTTTLRARSMAGLAGALEREALAQAVTLTTADLQEGLRARQERRPPVFTGR